jgi:hypothetical protein
VGDQYNALAALHLVKTQYPLYRRLGGPQGRSGQFWKILLPPGFDLCTIQPAVSHFTDYAVLAPTLFSNISEFWGPEEQKPHSGCSSTEEISRKIVWPSLIKQSGLLWLHWEKGALLHHFETAFGYFRGKKKKSCWRSLLCCAAARLVRNSFILKELQTEFVPIFSRVQKISVFLWCDFSMSFLAVALRMIQITQFICNHFV